MKKRYWRYSKKKVIEKKKKRVDFDIKWVWWSSTIRQAQTSGSQVSKTPTAELYGASQNREWQRIWDLVT